MPNIPLISFNAGELSPKIDARADIEKYASGCRTLENMIPVIYGDVERRPGTEFIYEAKYSPQGIKLIPFIYSAEIAYMCEHGNLYSRFYYDGAILLDDSSNPVEVVTPFLVGDLPELQYDQIADTQWLVHGSYPPQKLTRTTATTFSCDEIVFTKGPFLKRNDLDANDGITLTCSVTAADAVGTLTASGAVFNALHVGALFKLVHPRAVTQVSITAAGTSDPIDVHGNYTWTTSGTWTGKVWLQRNDNEAGWENYRSKQSRDNANIDLTKTEDGDNVQYRIYAEAGLTGSDFISDISVHDPDNNGVVRIDTVGGTTTATVTVMVELASTDTTTRWAEGAWSSLRGYPRAFCFFENRAVYAGTAHNPSTVWLSKSDQYENFEEGVNAADSFAVFITTTNEIRWIAALKSLCVGTSGDEWIIQSNRLDTPITPTGYSAKQQTAYGSAPVQPVKVNKSILYLDYVRRKVREFTAVDEYNSQYTAPDLTALAEHITESGLTCMAHQRNPDSILWSIRADGVLDSMTYEREQNTVGWARHLLGETSTDTSEVTGVGASQTPVTYINENGALWCLPINNRTILTLDADGVAVNVGGGIVGLPCTGHPFKSGDILYITGTTNYGGAQTLTSGTTANELQFTDTYVAETFDGTEVVQKKITTNSGAGRMAQDSSGNMYIGHGWDDSTYVTKIDLDGTVTYDCVTLDPVGPLGSTADVCLGLAVSADDKYLYLWVLREVLNDYGCMLKFDLTTGAELWRTTSVYNETNNAGYDMAIDASGNAYAPVRVGNATRKFASATGAGSMLTQMGDHLPGGSVSLSTLMDYCCIVDNDMGLVIVGGYSASTIEADGPYAYNLAVRIFDDSVGATLKVGGWYFETVWRCAAINSKCILTHDGYIYVLLLTPAGDTTPKIYKIEWTGSALNVVSEMTLPAYAVGFYIDAWDNLVVVNQNYSTTQTSVLHYYDWDLNYVSKIDNMYYACLGAWTAAAGGNWLQGDAVSWPRAGNVPSGYDYTANGIVQSVAIIPSTDEDEVWLAVQRYINGTARRFIERMKPRLFDTIADCFYIDCGLTITNTPASATITGLDHLIGEEVVVLGDGVVYIPTAAVDASGSITISTAVSVAQVGLAYRYKLKPMRPDIQTGQGTTHGSIVKVAEMGISFLNTMNAKYGVNYTNLYDINWTNVQWTNNSDITGLFTGDVVVNVDGGFTIDNPLIISGNDPLPCCVRALIPRQEKTGR